MGVEVGCRETEDRSEDIEENLYRGRSKLQFRGFVTLYSQVTIGVCIIGIEESTHPLTLFQCPG
jgi:hypothetical protein